MKFLEQIQEYLLDVTEFFYEAYLEVKEWIWPFYYAAKWFLRLADAFAHISVRVGLANDWAEDVTDQIEDILSWNSIKKLLSDWFEKAEDAYDWVKDAWDNVTDIIDEWWEDTEETVQGLIDIATEGFDELKDDWDDFWDITFPEWTDKLDGLLESWGEFLIDTLPTLVSSKWLTSWWNTKLEDVDQLINDIIKEWFPFYDELSELWKSIAEFFTDPLGWLEKHFIDWFLGPE